MMEVSQAKLSSGTLFKKYPRRLDISALGGFSSLLLVPVVLLPGFFSEKENERLGNRSKSFSTTFSYRCGNTPESPLQSLLAHHTGPGNSTLR
jgi:hypothetical protein